MKINNSKLIISKSEWQQIGLSKKWIKGAQLEDMFRTGNTISLGPKGRITVLMVDPDNRVAQVRDREGREYLMDIDTFQEIAGDLTEHRARREQEIAEEEAQRTEERRQRRRERALERREEKWDEIADQDLGITGPNEAYAIGLLAKHGVINIQVPDVDSAGIDYVKPFKEKYKRIAGEPLDVDNPYFQVYNRFTATGGLAKMSEELSIRVGNRIDDRNKKIITDTLGLTMGSNTDSLYGTPEVWRLIARGFRLGPNVDNISAIKKTIPDEFKRDFDLGASM